MLAGKKTRHIASKANGTLERYKTRLVVKGYTQTYDMNYPQTFALVTKMNTVKVLLSLAANYNWDLQKFNVKNAFLHEDLEEESKLHILSRKFLFFNKNM